MNLISTIMEAVKRATGNDPLALQSGAGFKSFGDTWFAWWSNSVEDRDGEYFSEKAIDEYVMRVDAGVVPYPELWLWHTPGTRIGAAEWVGRIGHFATAAGTFDDTPAGRAAKAHFTNKNSGDYGMSHGFYYEPGQKSDNTYHQFNTFEISVLPREKAANPYTAFEEVFDMEMSDQKRQWLAQVLGGDELATALIDATEAKSKAMDTMKMAYKDLVQMDAPDASAEHTHGEAEAVKEDMPAEDAPPAESAPAPTADLGEFVTSITEDVAAVANAVNSLIGKLDAVTAQGAAEKARHEKAEAELRAEVKALREAVDLRPRSASIDPATQVTKEALGSAVQEQITEQQTTLNSFWGVKVKKEGE